MTKHSSTPGSYPYPRYPYPRYPYPAYPAPRRSTGPCPLPRAYP